MTCDGITLYCSALFFLLFFLGDCTYSFWDEFKSSMPITDPTTKNNNIGSRRMYCVRVITPTSERKEKQKIGWTKTFSRTSLQSVDSWRGRRPNRCEMGRYPLRLTRLTCGIKATLKKILPESSPFNTWWFPRAISYQTKWRQTKGWQHAETQSFPTQ